MGDFGDKNVRPASKAGSSGGAEGGSRSRGGTGCSATSAPALVTVTPATAITSQPAGGSIPKNQSTTLTVVATGTGTLSYQWYEGASGDTTRPIPGAVASSWTTPILRKGTYPYWVRVSGSCGTVVSATAMIEAN